MIALRTVMYSWADYDRAREALENEAHAAGVDVRIEWDSVGVAGCPAHAYSGLDGYKLALEKALADVRAMSKPRARAGVSNARRVPCARKPENHGFHPSDESCPYCDGP